MRLLLIFLLWQGLVITLALGVVPVWAAKKLELEDVKIKGELLGDNRLRMLARERNSLKNYVKFRTNYRQDMAEELPEPEPRIKY